MKDLNLGNKAISSLLIVLLSLHIFHLFVSWKQSKVAHVEAIYNIPSSLAFISWNPNDLEAVLSQRLKKDGFFVDGYRPSISRVRNQIHLGFASPVLEAKEVTLNVGMDFTAYLLSLATTHDSQVSLATTHDSQVDTRLNCPNDMNRGKRSLQKDVEKEESAPLVLVGWSSRFNSWLKPLDILSLIVLVITLLLWLKGDTAVRNDN